MVKITELMKELTLKDNSKQKYEENLETFIDELKKTKL